MVATLDVEVCVRTITIVHGNSQCGEKKNSARFLWEIHQNPKIQCFIGTELIFITKTSGGGCWRSYGSSCFNRNLRVSYMVYLGYHGYINDQLRVSSGSKFFVTHPSHPTGAPHATARAACAARILRKRRVNHLCGAFLTESRWIYFSRMPSEGFLFLGGLGVADCLRLVFVCGSLTSSSRCPWGK